MLKAIEIKPDVFWVGGIDWNERNFHGYTTERGSTYNAYLILDEISTMLDVITQAQIWNFLIEETEARNIGMVVVSHNRELLKKVCTGIVEL